jgi:hypothetical protein
MHMTHYQIFNHCLAVHLNTGEILWINFNQNSGKVYYRNKIGSPTGSKHTGVYIGSDANGIAWWIHNHYHVGSAHLVTGSEFAKGRAVHLYHKYCTNTWQTVIQKALDHVVRGERYMPISNNCQTLVNDACHNVKTSHDANRIVGGALLGLGLFALVAAIASGGNGNK